MILIITSKKDSHVAAVSKHLDAAGIQWVRLNTEDLARNANITITPTTGGGIIHVRDSGRAIDLQKVRCVWFRKPDPVNLSHLMLDEGSLDYVEAEFNEILHGVYAMLRHVRWINDPFKTRIAHRKLLQLQVANRLGFNTPRTLVTNDAETALRFADEIGGDLAIKSLGAVNVTQNVDGQTRQFGIFTRRICRAELEEFQDKVRHLPTQFQEFVEKHHELRITCVGKRVFACRIEPRPGQLTDEDCRLDIYSLNHVACEYPELHEKLRAYMEDFELTFGCFDIGIRPTGEAVFFECNPNGQWQWVENLTGLQIGRAIAEELSAVA
jgi:glutathione synthase/RimK-type ligase-like ATP-grasp enzyme